MLLAGIHQPNADCIHLGLNKDIPLNKRGMAFSGSETLGIEKAHTGPGARELLMEVVFLCVWPSFGMEGGIYPLWLWPSEIPALRF